MAYKSRLFGTTAFLTGLTALAGGTCDANAGTLFTPSVTKTFSITAPFPPSGSGTVTTTETVMFPQFDGSLGLLTSVEFSLNSSIGPAEFGSQATGSVNVLGVPLSTSPSGSFTYDAMFSGLQGSLTTSTYTGTASSMFNVVFKLVSTSAATSSVWSGGGETPGLTLTYDYTPTPVPGALPLFASGLVGIGLTAWRSRRKRKTVEKA